MAKRSLAKRVWYEFLKVLCRLLAIAWFRLRVGGREHLPETGALLVLSNHQSHLDPILIGMCFRRRLNYLARETLFDFAPLRWLIQSLDAIPIDRDGLGLAGLKETLRRLKDDEAVLIFPEGTRSSNGEVGAMKPGFGALTRRGTVTMIPVAIEGAYQAWPRSRPFPLPGRIWVEFGETLSPDDLRQYDERALVAEVERRIRDCHARARARLQHLATGDLPSRVADTAVGSPFLDRDDRSNQTARLVAIAPSSRT